ncbi:iripin-3-like [Babylonia areolata]|uniref:iripin-3-like n=1 Tax=Babylonia areolata TaxID=304850 RepID=UPI003FD0278C
MTRKMYRALFFWTAVTLLCTVTLATDEGEKDESDSNGFEQETIIRAHQKLSTGLYKALSRKPGNLIISPWSVMTLLTVTYMVAGGRTASEIGDHLNVNLLRRKEILEGFERIHEMFTNTGANGSSSEVVESINGALIGRRVHPRQRLEKILRDNLHTYLHRIDTSPGRKQRDVNPQGSGNATTLPDGLRRENISEQLDGLMPGSGEMESKLSLWLFNWMSFQGAWRTPFDPRQTHRANFWTPGAKDPVPVDTMTAKADFPRSHFPQLEMTLLELPYGQAGRYGLFILLPDHHDGLPRLERKLRRFSMESMLAQPHWARMAKVFLPKFKFKTDMLLNEAMKKLGFRRMFSPKEADFTRLESKRQQQKRKKNGQKSNSPYVQTMVHRAAIEVSENGTSASASTGLRLVSRMYVYYFRVNHPFMFVLRDKTLGINLFIGRVTDPRELS